MNFVRNERCALFSIWLLFSLLFFRIFQWMIENWIERKQNIWIVRSQVVLLYWKAIRSSRHYITFSFLHLSNALHGSHKRMKDSNHVITCFNGIAKKSMCMFVCVFFGIFKCENKAKQNVFNSWQNHFFSLLFESSKVKLSMH